MIQSKKNVFFKQKKKFKKKTLLKKMVFNVYFYFLNLKKGKDISILWIFQYYVIHIIYCIIQALKHYMNCIHIDSDSNNFMIFINKILKSPKQHIV